MQCQLKSRPRSSSPTAAAMPPQPPPPLDIGVVWYGISGRQHKFCQDQGLEVSRRHGEQNRAECSASMRISMTRLNFFIFLLFSFSFLFFSFFLFFSPPFGFFMLSAFNSGRLLCLCCQPTLYSLLSLYYYYHNIIIIIIITIIIIIIH